MIIMYANKDKVLISGTAFRLAFLATNVSNARKPDGELCPDTANKRGVAPKRHLQELCTRAVYTHHPESFSF